MAIMQHCPSFFFFFFNITTIKIEQFVAAQYDVALRWRDDSEYRTAAFI